MDARYVDLTVPTVQSASATPMTELSVVRRQLDELVEERWLCGLTDADESRYRVLATREEELLHALPVDVPA
jgi:hypothetical protein